MIRFKAVFLALKVVRGCGREILPPQVRCQTIPVKSCLLGSGSVSRRRGGRFTAQNRWTRIPTHNRGCGAGSSLNRNATVSRPRGWPAWDGGGSHGRSEAGAQERTLSLLSLVSQHQSRGDPVLRLTSSLCGICEILDGASRVPRARGSLRGQDEGSWALPCLTRSGRGFQEVVTCSLVLGQHLGRRAPHTIRT